jgi:RNA polymerase sigma-70 factor (ECF subfamily)
MTQLPASQSEWSSLDDHILIKAYLRGEQAAFEVLFKKYRDLVGRLVFSIVRDASLVDDVVQDVFLLVYRHLHKFRWDSAFKTWIYRIAVNEAIRQLERGKRWQPFPEGDPEPSTLPSALVVYEVGDSPERMMIDGQRRELVHKALNSLRPHHRVILNLYYLEDQSIQEVAQILDIPEGSVKSRLFYARDALKNALTPALQPASVEKQRGSHGLS